MAYTYKTTPFDHQRAGLNHLKAWLAPEFFWRAEMGTGKSKMAIDNTAALYERGLVNGMLVTAPKTVCRAWSREQIPEHFPDRDLGEVLVYGPRTQRFARAFDELLTSPRCAVFIINYEAIITKEGRAHVERFLAARRTLWCADESDRIKNHTAKCTKVALKLAPLAAYRRAMTGTPVTRDPLDLWGQCEFLRHGILGDTSYWSFRARYAVLRKMYAHGRSFDTVEGFQNLDALRAILATFSYRVLKSECLDLPPKLYSTREVEMTPEQRRVYDELARDFKASIAGGECTASNVLARNTRFQQVLAGYLPTDDGQVHRLPCNRLAVLLEVLDEMDADQKAIVWCPYRADVSLVSEALTHKYGAGSVVTLVGSDTVAEREANMAAIQKGKARFLAGTQQTGGVGVTLTRANVVVYYGNTWHLRDRLQSEDRAHRIGQERAVSIVDLCVPDTWDETVLRGLRAKKTLADMVNEADPQEVVKWA